MGIFGTLGALMLAGLYAPLAAVPIAAGLAAAWWGINVATGVYSGLLNVKRYIRDVFRSEGTETAGETVKKVRFGNAREFGTELMLCDPVVDRIQGGYGSYPVRLIQDKFAAYDGRNMWDIPSVVRQYPDIAGFAREMGNTRTLAGGLGSVAGSFSGSLKNTFSLGQYSAAARWNMYAGNA
ncbi:hypothetical protein COY95_00595 [Candidatus Woesearchaeota archaeon CG_4_10_14_0_8_um_filter_47_5]|nr:MAG: hypothetical protein COY95_00595 [Candidatus Woesearchaeota archaeon CG_4_10_14_0_8_um_filter_47_5]